LFDSLRACSGAFECCHHLLRRIDFRFFSVVFRKAISVFVPGKGQLCMNDGGLESQRFGKSAVSEKECEDFRVAVGQKAFLRGLSCGCRSESVPARASVCLPVKKRSCEDFREPVSQKSVPARACVWLSVKKRSSEDFRVAVGQKAFLRGLPCGCFVRSRRFRVDKPTEEYYNNTIKLLSVVDDRRTL